MKSIFLTFAAFLISITSFCQSVEGKWKTIDDETGEVKSIVEIYKSGDALHGKIVKLFRKPTEDPNPKCTLCEDDRKNQTILGMEIIRDLKQDDDEWEDGTICDPKTGKVYDCSLWVDEDDPNKLQVRGYIAFFFRTQTWIRQ